MTISKLELPEELLVHGDEPLLQRGLDNLLENAGKYGAEGPMERRARRRSVGVRVLELLLFATRRHR